MSEATDAPTYAKVDTEGARANASDAEETKAPEGRPDPKAAASEGQDASTKGDGARSTGANVGSSPAGGDRTGATGGSVVANARTTGANDGSAAAGIDPEDSHGERAPYEQREETAAVVYDLSLLSTKRPGPVLAVGYGNPLKNLVRAARGFDVNPLFSTSTDDKRKAFAFGGMTNTASVGAKFDQRLFSNVYAVMTAAERCGAKTMLCATNVTPSELLAEECLRNDILLLVPVGDEKSLRLWKRVLPKEVAEDVDAIKAYKEALEPVEWRKCLGCGLHHDAREIAGNGYRCPDCGKLTRMSSDERILITFDEGSVEEWDAGVEQTNALDFPDFDSIIERNKERSGHDEGVITGRASVEGIDVAFGVMEPGFMMASMGHVVGERLAAMFERATEGGLPVVVFSSSGGARMQEGLVSLMQMAKVSAAVQRHSEAGLLYISVLTDPTTGGVTASFATLGDILIAEPGANIGFAGRRVVRDTIRQVLPDDFQTSEFALEHGLIDAIVEREEMRHALATLLEMHGYEPSPSYVPLANGASAVLSEAVEGAAGEGTASETAAGEGAAGDGTVGEGAVGEEHRNTSAGEGIAGETAAGETTVGGGKTEGDSVDSEGAIAEGEAEGDASRPNPSNILKSQSLEEFLGGLSSLAGAVGQAAGHAADAVGQAAGVVGQAITEQTTRASQWLKYRNKGVADIPYVKPGKPLEGDEVNTQWASVQLARDTKRPTSAYYIDTLFDDFFELHGDRAFADDGAIIGGIGKLGDRVVTVIAEEKGADLKERIARNFGCPQPEGYRKSMRLMKQAEKFGRPIVCLVDTQGAFCGKEAEERGIGNAIAESLALMSDLEVPVVSVIIGEGGSGGALALAVANKVAMQENAVYSVLSPEGFASILWKDGSRAAEAAEVMKVGASDAFDLGVIEDVIVEGHGPAQENPDQAAAALWLYLNTALDELADKSPEELKEQRYERFRKY